MGLELRNGLHNPYLSYMIRVFGLLVLLAIVPISNAQFRPPAVPLVTSDPYLSIWSEANRLTDDVTRHWTRSAHPLSSLIRIDGTTYRLMGKEPAAIPPLPQTVVEVTPTRSIYKFSNEHVSVGLTFMTPALPNDLNVYARPITYLTWAVRSLDGRPHEVEVMAGCGAEISVDRPTARVKWQWLNENLGGGKIGSVAQTLLRPAGDDTRIDWGYLYASAPSANQRDIGSLDQMEQTFVDSGRPHQSDHPLQADDGAKGFGIGFLFDLGPVGSKVVERHLMIGYDELYSIEYYGRKLRPYWRRNGTTPESLFRAAERDYSKLKARCEQFDQELTADATKLGGRKYAQILALSYRECVAANGLAADANGQPLFFTKENTSNGDIATVDVIFPMDPIWILLSPTLAKASLVSNFMYAASPHWKFPNAPHDLGTYPQVFGRDNGGEGMPVEESGNMIILTDAIAHDDGNAKFAARWWPQLTQWAHYLEKYGLDPEDQLCTDDFMGHLAHNANLSVKAILALAAYGDLCHIKGDELGAKKYRDLAKADALHWVLVADAGTHSLLAFDQPNSWSQKYNLVWDRILGLNVFPEAVAAKEVAFYKSVLQPFGVPLDSRTHLTKTDWSIWCATMATTKADFEALVDPIYDYLNQTTARDPIADSYMTDNPRSGGMHARPVVGGFFIRMLSDKATWTKWARRDRIRRLDWAPLPKPPVITEVVPTARTGAQSWRYTTQRPGTDWTNPKFDDSSWPVGRAGFGTEGTPDAIIGTKWDTPDIWIRRSFVMPQHPKGTLALIVYHDEDVEVFINGVPATEEAGYVNRYQPLSISAPALSLLKPGSIITLAAHCHQTEGGQGVDVGIGVVSD